MEYFIDANSFAAPFCSDSSTAYIKAETPEDALREFASKYTHPCGLYSAFAYTSSDAKNKGEKPLAKWLCNHEQERERLTAGLSCHTFLGHAPGKFEINGELHIVKNPKEGSAL